MKKIKAIFAVLSSLCCFYVHNTITANDSQKYVLTLKNIKNQDYSLKTDFLKELANMFTCTVFIESGTYMGETVKKALPFFNEIHSIELAKNLYLQASKRFEQDHHVKIHFGNSPEILSKILPFIQGKILFWLDGHYSGGQTAKGNENTPIIQELTAIKNSGITNAIILVDDIRCFQHFKNVHDTALLGYPSVNELRNAILAINPNYQFIIYGDIAIAYDTREPIISSPVIQACTKSRLFEDEQNVTALTQTLEAEKIIAGAEGEEKEAIKALPVIFPEQSGLGKYFILWNGLVLTQEKKHAEARKKFLRALELGCPFKQISFYLEKLPT